MFSTDCRDSWHIFHVSTSALCLKNKISKELIWNWLCIPLCLDAELVQSEWIHVQASNAIVEDSEIRLRFLLRHCIKNQDLRQGTSLHKHILQCGLLKRLSDGLVAMYAGCGALQEARDLFEVHKSKDAFTWTALIAGYVQAGKFQHALDLFERMQEEGLSPNAVTYSCILKACGSLRAADRGSKIHDDVSKRGFLRSNVKLGNSLLAMYVKCGDLPKAQQVLDELPFRNIISWTALISGYSECGEGQKAILCFEQMLRERLSPNAVTFTCLLKACSNCRALEKGKEIHDEIAKQGLLKRNIVLGTALVDMYAKCGDISKARCVLEGLPCRNVVSWNVLVASYAECGQCEHALDCLDQMQRERLSPDEVTFVCILKACTRIRALDMGGRIHDEIAKHGLLRDSHVLGNALVDLYAKCGAFSKARQVLQKLPLRNAISWNALISGYAEHGEGELALESYEQMQREGFSPGVVTFTCLLKACGSIGAADEGEKIHHEITRQGLLKNDIIIGSALVDMYVKCGALAKAQHVHEELPVRDVICWTSLIAGYVDNAEDEQAIVCFDLMQYEGLSPSEVTFSCVLKACGNMRAATKGERIHNEIAKQGLLAHNAVLAYALVEMYAKCGALEKAHNILAELPARNVITWNALIAACIEHGEEEQALACFDQMVHEGLSPDSVTFSCLLKVCGSMGAVHRGEKIHEEIVNQRLLEKDVKLGTALVDMYAKCGFCVKARQVLEELPVRDAFSWTSLISAYAENGKFEIALDCFEQMENEGLSPDAVSFACFLKACGCIGAVDWGKRIHHEILKTGLLGTDCTLGTAVVDMYAKCGDLKKAQQALEELPIRSVQSWNALIAGYSDQGKHENVLGCFEQMRSDGVCADAVTFLYILKVCSNIGTGEMGSKVHDEIAKDNLICKHAYLGTGLIGMYAKCGALMKAQQVLKQSPVRDIMPWNSLIAGYVEHGEGKQALNLFEQLQHEGMSPNVITYAHVLKACGNVGAVCKGKLIHHQVAERGLLETDIFLGNAVVDMYSKCGVLTKAWQTLDELPVRDASSWNVLMAGLNENCESLQTLTCFEQMQCEGVSPNAITFTCVLNACSRLGLPEIAQIHFLDMNTRYHLEPELVHYSCMVDAYGRAGWLDLSIKMTEQMPFSLGGVCSTLLSSCQRWGHLSAGRWAFQSAL